MKHKESSAEVNRWQAVRESKAKVVVEEDEEDEVED